MDILHQLTNLAALSERNGLIEIKPFKSWKKDKYWAEAVFKIRLLNAGEILEVASYSDQFTSDAKEKAVKIETVARCLYEINGVPLGSSEELTKYNERHNSKLTRLEYLRNWVKDLEQLVLDYIYTNYVGLQMKQVRLVTNQQMCEICGQVWEKENVPLGSKETRYSVGEIVCGNCIKENLLNTDDFDFFEEYKNQSTSPLEEKKEEDSLNKEVSKETHYTCVCNQEFDTLEKFVEHRSECPKANGE